MVTEALSDVGVIDPAGTTTEVAREKSPAEKLKDMGVHPDHTSDILDLRNKLSETWKQRFSNNGHEIAEEQSLASLATLAEAYKTTNKNITRLQTLVKHSIGFFDQKGDCTSALQITIDYNKRVCGLIFEKH